MIASPEHRLLSYLLPLLLLAMHGWFLTQKIFLISSDLGRHIRNGEMIVEHMNRAAIATNFYSYTAPEFPVQNHHWLTGVIFYLLWQNIGMAGLQAFCVALRLAVLWLFFDVARRRAGTGVASIVGALLVFVLAERIEIRPEIFSYAFCGVFFWLLSRVRSGEISARWLWALPFLQIPWVNLHIYFILGPAIIAAYWIESLAIGNARARQLGVVMLLALLASLVNPFGLRGAIAPFVIFENYGLSIAENQTAFLIVSRVGGITYVVFLIAASLLVASFLLATWKRRQPIAWSDVLLGTGVTAMACLAVRNLTLFALFALPLLAGNVAALLPARAAPARWEPRTRWAALPLLLGLAVFVTTFDLRRLKYMSGGQFGFGVETGNNDAADFFVTHGVRGPVFNNFDVGGYLIFHLWPRERVFVDNRPEAYPAEFFRDVYWPMLKEPAAWSRREKQYGFNAIFFTHGDLSAAAQQFLIDRLRDPAWVVVFCDAYNVIFVRRTPQNAELIARFAPSI